MNSVIINVLNEKSENEINYLIDLSNKIGCKTSLILIGQMSFKLRILPLEKVTYIPIKNIYSANKRILIDAISKHVSSNDLVLFCANDLSNELANLLACKLNYNILTNAINVANNGNELIITKQIYSNNLFANYQTNSNTIISIYYNSIFKLDIEKLVLLTDYYVYNINLEDKPRFKLIDSIYKDTNKLANADIVILVGKGVRKEDLSKVQQLATYLDAEVGATRPVTYLGLLPLSKMVGSSNISINPKVLITLGVSGSAPLLTGIKNSKKIISINKDKSAMIFAHSDIGIIADTKDFLNEYIKQIR